MVHCCYLLEDQTTSEPFSISPFPQHATFGENKSSLLSIGLVQKRLNYKTVKILIYSQFGVEIKLISFEEKNKVFVSGCAYRWNEKQSFSKIDQHPATQVTVRIRNF
jgi:hypothetical protein